MKKLLLLSVIALVALSCQNQQTASSTGKETDTTDTIGEDTAYIDSLGLWEEENLKVNPGYVHLADALWRHRFDEPNLTKDMEWVEKEQQKLAQAFDSVHPNNKTLTLVQKADSMANELRTFLHKDKEENQFDIKHNAAKDVTFDHYRLLSDYAKLLQEHPDYKLEIERWNNFGTAILGFMENAVSVENYGGSIRGVNAIGTEGYLMYTRLNSVQTMLSKKSSRQKDNVETAKQALLKALDKRYQTLVGCDLEDEQKDCLKEMDKQRKTIASTLDAWLKERHSLSVDEGNTVKVLQELKALNAEPEMH